MKIFGGIRVSYRRIFPKSSDCESMRLCPPVAVDEKFAADDDVLPDRTVVKKGYSVSYHVYAMGKSGELWRWMFKPGDAYEYLVFQAGPSVCLGREMTFLQMKRVVTVVLRRFRVVPAVDLLLPAMRS